MSGWCPDELDEFGGLCAFSRARQLYYSADALAWIGGERARRAELLATEALSVYETADEADRAFGDEAGSRCALALARLRRDDVDGAAAAMASVFELPWALRTHGVVTAAEHVQNAAAELDATSPVVTELLDGLRDFTTTRLALPPS